MIGRNSKKSPPAPPEPEPQSITGKGRPTPKRRDAEARNQRPLVPDDRKVARKQAREHRNAAYARQQEAMRTGDERYLPVRDKGRPRRWVRNYVDSHTSPSEFFLILAMASIVLLFFANQFPELAVTAMLVMYIAFAISLVFALVYSFIIVRKIKARFDEDEIPRWTGLYAFTRLFQPRFLRAPKPQVKRGQKFDER